MKAIIEPGSVRGSIQAPPSKSMTQRVYAAALLHRGQTIVAGAGTSDDEQAALGIIGELGAQISEQGPGVTLITSEGVKPIQDNIFCGESGLSARLFIPVAALCSQPVTVNGTGSLLLRPMGLYARILPEFKVAIETNNGFLPARITGPLVPSDVTIDGSESSQFLSGLLFAISAAQQQGTTTITVKDLMSKPYSDMTVSVLRRFGFGIEQQGYQCFTLSGLRKDFNEPEISIVIESDWSSAAYFLVAGAIAGDVTVRGLEDNHLQADSAILSLLTETGADISRKEGEIRVKKKHLFGFEFDATDCPDLFPILAILAACCSGESYISGVHRLFTKESNRAESISEMLENFDVPFSIESDMLCVTGVRKLRGTVIDPHRDHRIVMAAAIGALRASGRVDILDAGVVNKSYPGFFNDFAQCGGNYTFNNDL